MMSKLIDMTGWLMSEHGVPDSRLTVIEHLGNGDWLVECNCDKHTRFKAAGLNIRRGNTKSCGCLHQEITSKINKKYNTYDLSGEYGIGWTSNTNNKFYFELKDYDIIKNLCWLESVDKGVHRLIAHNPRTKKNIRMHVLLGYKNYDHIDKNELNNLRSNLRPCTHQQNDFNRDLYSNNTSGITGVYWSKACQKWQAAITINAKTIYLGVFIDKINAIKARLEAEVKYFGEFAPQRHLFKQYNIEVKYE